MTHTPTLRGDEHRMLAMYVGGRYLHRKLGMARGAYEQSLIAALVDVGLVRCDDLTRSAITVTDAGRDYIEEHGAGVR